MNINGKPRQLRCSSCYSSEFYEDDQGNMNCVHCHIQSQDFIAEAADLYDEGMMNTTNPKYRRSISTPKGQRLKSGNPDEPELKDYLVLYQNVLIMLMKCTMKIIFENDDEYENYKVEEHNRMATAIQALRLSEPVKSKKKKKGIDKEEIVEDHDEDEDSDGDGKESTKPHHKSKDKFKTPKPKVQVKTEKGCMVEVDDASSTSSSDSEGGRDKEETSKEVITPGTRRSLRLQNALSQSQNDLKSQKAPIEEIKGRKKRRGTKLFDGNDDESEQDVVSDDDEDDEDDEERFDDDDPDDEDYQLSGDDESDRSHDGRRKKKHNKNKSSKLKIKPRHEDDSEDGNHYPHDIKEEHGPSLLPTVNTQNKSEQWARGGSNRPIEFRKPYITLEEQKSKEQYNKKLQDRLLKTLKSIWMKYIEEWMNTSAPCQLIDAFCLESMTCQCTTDGKKPFIHPLYPTKPLLLGFIYLTLRVERLDIIPADIVRWCERGLIPYSNIWECIPEFARNGIPLKRARWIFQANHKGSVHRFISTANIWFHTVSIAESIHMEDSVPPLNAPLVAYGMIRSLGLPYHVWELYCDLSHVYTCGTPMVGAESYKQQYAENILALILICCLMCDNISEWMTMYHDNYDEGLEFYEDLYIKKKQHDEMLRKNMRSGSSSYYYDSEGIEEEEQRLDGIAGRAFMGITNKNEFDSMKMYCMPNPVIVEELENIPRRLLPILLIQIRRCQVPYKISSHSTFTSTNFKFNKLVKSFLSSIKVVTRDNNDNINTNKQQLLNDFLNKTVEEYMTTRKSSSSSSSSMGRIDSNISQTPYRSPRGTSNIPSTSVRKIAASTATTNIYALQQQYTLDLREFHSFSNTCKMFPIAIHSKLPFEEYLNKTEKKYNEALNYSTKIPRTKEISKDEGFHRFISHSRHTDDLTGLRPMIYTLLLERFARYLYVPPYVIHAIVESFDRQITEFVFDGQITKYSTDLNFRISKRRYAMHEMVKKSGKRRLKKINKTTLEHDVHNFAKYRRKCNDLLPLIKELANTGLMPDLDEEWSDDEENGDGDEYWKDGVDVDPNAEYDDEGRPIVHLKKKRKKQVLASLYEFHDWWSTEFDDNNNSDEEGEEGEEEDDDDDDEDEDEYDDEDDEEEDKEVDEMDVEDVAVNSGGDIQVGSGNSGSSQQQESQASTASQRTTGNMMRSTLSSLRGSKYAMQSVKLNQNRGGSMSQSQRSMLDDVANSQQDDDQESYIFTPNTIAAAASMVAGMRSSSQGITGSQSNEILKEPSTMSSSTMLGNSNEVASFDVLGESSDDEDIESDGEEGNGESESPVFDILSGDLR